MFLLLALTTAEAIQVVGVLLVLTLVITPAAAAQRLTVRPGLAILLSIAIALLATEGGILLSLAKPWPTSFFISSISFAAYLLARIVEATRDRRRSQPTERRRRRNASADTTKSETRPAASAATSE
jgi:zinc/manganese transport system permease protein